MSQPLPIVVLRWVLAGLVCALVLLCLWPGLHGGFIFDDFPNLVRADGWKADALSIEALLHALQSDISGTVGRPLSLLSFAVNHAFTGLSPFWLKLTNLVWHGFNGLLIWLLCRRICACVPELERPAPWLALFVALFWLLHPLQVSTVLYVVQRMEIAAASGIVLALLAYVSARTRQQQGRTAWPWLLLAGLMMMLGLGFKETALLTPLFALLLELCLFRFRTSGGAVSRAWVIGWLVVLLLGLIAYLGLIIPRLQHWPHATRGWGPGERLLTQAPVLVMYLKQILLPLPDSFTFYYDNFPVSRGLDMRTLLSVAALLGMMAFAVICRRRWPLTSLGIGWFFVAHALTSNLWPLELAFEHRNYLALFGIGLTLVQPVFALLRRLNTDALVVVALLPIALLAVLTHVQARTWGDPMRLAWTLENRNPQSPRASYSLGEQFVRRAAGDTESISWGLALGQFEHAAGLPGDPVLPLQALILLPAQSGQQVPPERWARFRHALTQRGFAAEHAGALYAVSQCRIEGRCVFDDGELLQTFLVVVEQMPNNASALTLYANFSWNVLADRALAIRLQRDAAALAPKNPSYRIALAKFLLASGGTDAVQEARQLLGALQQENKAGLLDSQLNELERMDSSAAKQDAGG